MALRSGRGAGRGRLARRGARPLAVVALYLAAGCLATWPALRDARGDFLALGEPRPGRVTPGDHLQTAYSLWLPGHQVERAARPWIDTYSFQPEAGERIDFAGWPFALVWWPLDLVLDTPGAWNVFVLLTYVGAGAAAALWLRALGLRDRAALVGGLAFALAPYRVAQSTGHLLGPISLFLPLALWAVETRRRWIAALALASIPLSGQVHLALGAVPFVVGYAACRGRWRVAVPAAAASVAAGLLVWAASIRGTTGGSGRSFAEVERYSADWGDFVARGFHGNFERFVFVGWLTPLLALAGLALLLAAGRRGLAAALGAGAIVPAVLALGANVPLYEPLWRHTPGLHATRVPERLLPIACLAVAGLVAFAVDRAPWALAPVVAAAAIALDLKVDVYDAVRADEGNRAYAALRREPPGRVLELPVRLPDEYAASVSLYYSLQAPREHPTGYSTTAPKEAERTLRRLRAATCSGSPGAFGRLARDIGIRYVVEHEQPGLGCLWTRALGPRRLVARDGTIRLWALQGLSS